MANKLELSINFIWYVSKCWCSKKYEENQDIVVILESNWYDALEAIFSFILSFIRNPNIFWNKCWRQSFDKKVENIYMPKFFTCYLFNNFKQLKITTQRSGTFFALLFSLNDSTQKRWNNIRFYLKRTQANLLQKHVINWAIFSCLNKCLKLLQTAKFHLDNEVMCTLPKNFSN